MQTAAKPAIAPLHVLLVGDHEEEFFLIRDMLERNRSVIAVELEHARSLEEARELMQHRPFGLVLFEHDAGDAEAVRLMTDFLHAGRQVPFIVLTEDADEKTVGEIIGSGTWKCLALPRFNPAEQPTGGQDSGDSAGRAAGRRIDTPTAGLQPEAAAGVASCGAQFRGQHYCKDTSSIDRRGH